MRAGHTKRKYCQHDQSGEVLSKQNGLLYLACKDNSYEIMTETDGIYGGRFSGAGFKGCCMALIDPSYEERITQKVTEAYLKACPAMRGKFSVHICESADGVSTL